MSSPRAPGLPAAGGPAQSGGDERDAEPADEEPRREHDRGGGQERGRRADAGGAGRERDEGGPDASEVQALEGVDVADHPCQQVALPEALELGRGERLDPLVEAGADAAEGAERQVVRPEPVGVARQRPGKAEEAHRDDCRRQRENRRALRGARDQVAGGGHQRDAEHDGERPERDGDGDPPGSDSREREQAAEHRHHATASTRDSRHASALEPHDPVGARRPTRGGGR